MPIRYLIFDLDETLYSRDAGVMQSIRSRIRRYLVEALGYSAEDADALARRYHQEYGTTLQGLLEHRQVDPEHYLAFVHEFSLDGLPPNPQLDRLLASLPGEKVVFTNADRAHAERVLARLGIRHHFSAIIDVVAAGYRSKPDPATYQTCLQMLGAKPEECVLIEDSARNLVPATQLGMTTILVDGEPDEAADYRVRSILELGPVIEEICRERDGGMMNDE